MQIISQTTLRTPWVPALSVTRERMESWLRSALKYFSTFLVKYFQSTCLPGLICAKSVEDGELIPRLVHSHWSMSVETVLSLVGVCWSQQKTRNALISSQSPSLGFWWIELCLYIFKLFSDSRSCFPSIYGVNGCTSITTADGQKEACFCNTELLVESKYWADCSSRGQGFKCCWHPYSHWSRSMIGWILMVLTPALLCHNDTAKGNKCTSQATSESRTDLECSGLSTVWLIYTTPRCNGTPPNYCSSPLGIVVALIIIFRLIWKYWNIIHFFFILADFFSLCSFEVIEVLPCQKKHNLVQNIKGLHLIWCSTSLDKRDLNCFVWSLSLSEV